MDQPSDAGGPVPRPLIAAHEAFAERLDALALSLRPLVDEAGALRVARDRAYRAAAGAWSRDEWAAGAEEAFLDAVMDAGGLELRLWELEQLMGEIIEPRNLEVVA